MEEGNSRKILEASDISYLIPIRNAAREIAKCLQTIESVDINSIILVDDNSTDDTLEVLRKFNDKRIKVVSSTGFGISDALNTGLDTIDAKAIFRLDIDDQNIAGRDLKYIDILNRFNPDVIFSNASICPKWKELFRPRVFKSTKSEDLEWLLLISNVLIHPTAGFNMQNISSLRYEKEDGIEDYLLWIKLLREGKKFHLIHDDTIIYDRSRSFLTEFSSRQKRISSTAQRLFENFQFDKIGSVSSHGARYALSGGASRVKMAVVVLYYIRITSKAPRRVLANLVLNQSIMILKGLIWGRRKF
jgi:glycosyltransferase involved in cell wall biosynthesis